MFRLMQYIYYHINELKLRFLYSLFSLIITLCVSYIYKCELLYLITRPFLELQQKFIFVDLTEALYTVIRLCICITFIFITLYILYQIWSFFIPSCYFSERLFIHKILIVFFLLFIVEGSCIYFFLCPKIVEFLSSFQVNTPLPEHSGSVDFVKNTHFTPSLFTLELSARIESYVQLILRISIFIFIFCQIPVVFIVFYSNQLCNGYDLCINRKRVFFFFILFSAFISPPDLLTQFFVILLFVVLFEFLIFLGLVFQYLNSGVIH